MTIASRRDVMRGGLAAAALIPLAAIPAQAAAIGRTPIGGKDIMFQQLFGAGSRTHLLEVLTDFYAPEYPRGSFFAVDPDRAPKDDDLVYVRFQFKGDARAWSHILPYKRREGHDEHGRFCLPGAGHEIVCVIGPIKFTRNDMARGSAKVLGTVCGVIAKL